MKNASNSFPFISESPSRLTQQHLHPHDSPNNIDAIAPMRANRFRPSPEALLKTRAYRGRNLSKSPGAIIREKPFKRLIESALHEYQSNLRIHNSAFKLLRSAAESYLAHVFEDTNSITLHSKRRSIKPADITIARKLRGER